MDATQELVGAVIPTLGYLDQARSILLGGSSKGVSSLGCICLLTANLLRCIIWLYDGGKMAKLISSLAEIATQIPLLILIIRYSPKPKQKKIKEKEVKKPSKSSSKKSKLAEEMNSIIPFEFYVTLVITIAVASLYSSEVGAVNPQQFTAILSKVMMIAETLAPVPQVLASLRAGPKSRLSTLYLLIQIITDLKRIATYTFTKANQEFVFGAQIQLVGDGILLLQLYTANPNLRGLLLFPITFLVGALKLIVGFVFPPSTNPDDLGDSTALVPRKKGMGSLSSSEDSDVDPKELLVAKMSPKPQVAPPAPAPNASPSRIGSLLKFLTRTLLKLTIFALFNGLRVLLNIVIILVKVAAKKILFKPPPTTTDDLGQASPTNFDTKPTEIPLPPVSVNPPISQDARMMNRSVTFNV